MNLDPCHKTRTRKSQKKTLKCYGLLTNGVTLRIGVHTDAVHLLECVLQRVSQVVEMMNRDIYRGVVAVFASAHECDVGAVDDVVVEV